jgi:predicted lipoprotein
MPSAKSNAMPFGYVGSSTSVVYASKRNVVPFVKLPGRTVAVNVRDPSDVVKL